MASFNEKEPLADVAELCVILQCLGYNIQSLDKEGRKLSQEFGSKTIAINCQSSGLHAVLQNASPSCTCPATEPEGGSGLWQVSAISGGRQCEKEFGSSLVGTLPKSFRAQLAIDLQNLVRGIRQNNEELLERHSSMDKGNKSASMVDLKLVDDNALLLNTDASVRYHSLDALINSKSELPTPGALVKRVNSGLSDKGTPKMIRNLCHRQGTYTVASGRHSTGGISVSTPGSMWKNKTSSPIKSSSVNSILDRLEAAKKSVEDVWGQLSYLVDDISEERKNDTSVESLALDMSKISLHKVTDMSKNQFASSPNLSGLPPTPKDDKFATSKTKLNRFESVSTSNLTAKKVTPNKEGERKYGLRRLSPSFFRSKKDVPKIKDDKITKTPESTGNKFHKFIKPKILTPLRTPVSTPDISANISANKKKFSHIKSTIPRLTQKKE